MSLDTIHTDYNAKHVFNEITKKANSLAQSWLILGLRSIRDERIITKEFQ